MSAVFIRALSSKGVWVQEGDPLYGPLSNVLRCVPAKFPKLQKLFFDTLMLFGRQQRCLDIKTASCACWEAVCTLYSGFRVLKDGASINES